MLVTREVIEIFELEIVKFTFIINFKYGEDKIGVE